MYIAKYFIKIYACLGSKIPHGKKESKQEKNSWEKKREKRKLAQQIINSVFLQNEVTN